MKDILSAIKQRQVGILLSAALFTGLFLLYLIFDVLGRVSPETYRKLTDLTITVEHKDGTIDTFNSHLFNFTSHEDVITIHIPLKKEWQKDHQSVNFFFYNSVVKAYYKNRFLISYGENINRHMIGNVKVSIPVPPEAFGDEIRVLIYPRLNILEDTFRVPVLMSELASPFFPIIGLEAFYAIFSVILVFSFIGIIMFAFIYPIMDFAREGTWLMALIFAITLWYMGNSGMIYMIVAREDITAISEYIGMYLLFSAAPLYASYETERPLLKKYLTISGYILFGFFWLCLILYILPTGLNYVTYLRQMQTLQIVMVFSSLMTLLLPDKKRKHASDHVMGYGMTIVALFGILEQVRIILSAQITEDWPWVIQWFTKAHFSIALILALVITLFSSYIIKVKHLLQRNLREKHLEILAYTDNLTSLGNRQFLQRKLNILDAGCKDDYAIIFIDINDLKITNDHWGHEAGDQLIKMVAGAATDAMENNYEGFVGRNGGDEFICVVIPATKAPSIAKAIQDNLVRTKEQEKPPFPLSVALGVATYREVLAKTPAANRQAINSSHVIKLADERMYEAKTIQKKNRLQ